MRQNIPLAPLLSLGTGGQARWFCDVTSEAELIDALAWAQHEQLPTHVLGGGSNLVVTDAPVEGLVVRVKLRGVDGIHPASDGVVRVTAAAGEPWDDFVAACCRAGLAGLECLGGIPGLVGAVPIQNVGAYGQEVSQTIVSVRCVDRHRLRSRELKGDDCEFAYRSSRFKHRDAGRFVVTQVSFDLLGGGAPSVRYAELEKALVRLQLPAPSLDDVRQLVMQLRRAKSMLLDPDDPNGRSCGSFFTNPILSDAQYAALCERCKDGVPPRFPAPSGFVKVPAAWLIENAGFAKGMRDGNVGLSTVHTLCVVAHDAATSEQVVAFARRLRDGVERHFGVVLEPEPVFVGLTW